MLRAQNASFDLNLSGFGFQLSLCHIVPQMAKAAWEATAKVIGASPADTSGGSELPLLAVTQVPEVFTMMGCETRPFCLLPVARVMSHLL